MVKSKLLMVIPFLMISSFPLKNRLILFLMMLLSTILLGSLGYVIIKVFVEHQSTSFTDAIYFSIATISTLGHYPAGIGLESEIGKWFTILYLIFGLGVIFGGIQALLGPWIEMKVKSAVHERRLPIPEDAHIIIAGYNDIGKVIKDELEILDLPFVIVDEKPPQDVPSVEGKPTEMENLQKANIERAKALIAVGDNETNVVTILTARRLNGKLNIIALAQNGGVEDILYKCGANRVISRDRVINAVLSHWIRGDFVHHLSGEIFKDTSIEEYRVDKRLDGKSIIESKIKEKRGTIIAIYRGSRLIVNPAPQFILRKGDVLILFKGGA